MKVRLVGRIGEVVEAYPRVLSLVDCGPNTKMAKTIYFLSPNKKPIHVVSVDTKGTGIEHTIPKVRSGEMPRVVFLVNGDSAKQLNGKMLEVLVRVNGSSDPIPVKLRIVSMK